MIGKQYAGVLPEPGRIQATRRQDNPGAGRRHDRAGKGLRWPTQQIHQALNAIWAVVAEANRYFAGEAPWALAKTDPKRQATVLYVTAEVVRQIAIMTQFAMPAASAKMLDILGIPDDIKSRNFAALGGRILPGTVLPPPAPVFPRYIEPAA